MKMASLVHELDSIDLKVNTHFNQSGQGTERLTVFTPNASILLFYISFAVGDMLPSAQMISQ